MCADPPTVKYLSLCREKKNKKIRKRGKVVPFELAGPATQHKVHRCIPKEVVEQSPIMSFTILLACKYIDIMSQL